jgi:phenylpyruvate tautomerase PptA (4-oxalocrotonate tautomerase family)
MPLVHIYLVEGKSPEYLEGLGDGIHEALMQAWNIPELDRFQIIDEKKSAHFHINKEVFGIKRSNDVVVVHITTSPRTKEMKLAFYEKLPSVLNQKIGIRPEDVFIILTATELEDWSLGNGKAQLLE